MWVLLAYKNVIGVVAELESKIVAVAGFCIDSVHPTHLTIVDLAVHPSQRRQGYGLKIVSKLNQKLCVHWKKEIHVDVREKNLGAQKFLYTAGYRAYGVKPGTYEDTREDAYEFVYDLERVLTP
jgi:ribosomal protein S18 acetylase RimI-like enzyme